MSMEEKDFIERIALLAQTDMHRSGVLASVTIAQACLESNYGRSELAVMANNLFGMKTSLSGNTWKSVWAGDKYNKKTSECINGKWQAVTADFRAYPDIETSIRDHSLYLTCAPNGNMLRYAGLAGEMDPRTAIIIIKSGGYATDPDYVDKVMAAINAWNLTQYDHDNVEESEMEINKYLTSYNHNTGTADRIKYIVIHYVGATGGAEANCKYYATGNVGASAHYFVGFDGEIWQSVEDQNIAWHCGAKTYKHPECRNANSIGIEMCVRNKGNQADTSKDWYFEDATVTAAIRLTKMLMHKYNIPADHVIRHYDVTGKICPNPYVYNHTAHTWEVFRTSISEADTKAKPSGWRQDDEGWKYYLSDTGECVRNDWYQDGDKWYWFNGAGYMVCSTWYQYNDSWYYLGSDGAMCTGLQDINGKWYYLYAEGKMATEPVVLTPDQDGALQYPGLAK